MGTVVRTPRNHREAVPGRKNEGEKPLSRPRFSPLESLGHLSSHRVRSVCDAAARSTFQPATLCQITRNTLPRPRTCKRPRPSRFFKPLLVDSIPDRGRVPPGRPTCTRSAWARR